MQAPGFWDDQERASSVSAEHAALSRRLDTYRSLETEPNMVLSVSPQWQSFDDYLAALAAQE